ncbi:MAG: NAD(P)-binding protein [bacterium]
MDTDARARPVETERCALCIVGAGLAGLNALFVAARYLAPGDRVILVDQRDRVGGMWHTTYDHVRLHQPHRVFTAGNIPWQLAAPAAYRADRAEILAHFDRCLAELRGRVTLTERFAHTYQGHDEVEVDGRHEAHVRLRPRDPGAPDRLIRARRLIKAFGFDVRPLAPLPLSSARVRSIAPESPDFLGGAMQHDDAPIYVVGGGKTGTDAAHHAIERYPGRRVELIVGRGKAFLDRSKLFPEGPARYLGGTLILDMMRDLALRYDGDNDDAVFAYFLDRYGLALDGPAHACLFGLISPDEIAAIDRGAARITPAYLEDVVDDGDTPVMVYRDGRREPIEPGSWIVNCTGHLLRDARPHEPCVSPHGTTLSIQQTAAITFVTSFGAYFLTHLWLMGKLPGVPLWVMNHEALDRASSRSYLMAASTQLVYNIMQIIDAVPPRVILDCGINFDNWYPLYRVLWIVAKLKARKRAYLPHLEATLRRIEERHGIRGEFLPTATI